jgi:phosphoglycolate phosphatase
LIDSAPGILTSFESALKRAAIKPLVPLNESLIGPPLRQTLVNLTGVTTSSELDMLAGYFKDAYDSEGYKATLVYDGVEELLSTLASNEIPMAIATNKREVPTLKILKYFNWGSYFRSVGALDSRTPAYPDKAALIKSILSELEIEASSSLYIGDKREDAAAADANQMLFTAAGWGYGEWESAAEMSNGWLVVKSAKEFIKLFFG